MILLVLSIILLDHGLLVRQDGSLHEINAAKEDHKWISLHCVLTT
jgi:hypothetical protein